MKPHDLALAEEPQLVFIFWFSEHFCDSFQIVIRYFCRQLYSGNRNIYPDLPAEGRFLLKAKGNKGEHSSGKCQSKKIG